mmetsp:Transcript_22091/g.61462  ORF Transcript_22091/g.61462 Transcript_22091/m.61462 type:complete len:331 (-) Transcript_22091:63-1055(-)
MESWIDRSAFVIIYNGRSKVWPFVIVDFLLRHLAHGVGKRNAQHLVHLAPIGNVPFDVVGIRRPPQRIASELRRRAFVHRHEMGDEPHVVVGEARRLLHDAAQAHGPEMQAHPHAAFLQREVTSRILRRAFEGVPCRDVGRRTIVHDDGVPAGDGMRRLRIAVVAAVVVPDGGSRQLLVDPLGEALAVGILVRSDEEIQGGVLECQLVELVRHARQVLQRDLLLDELLGGGRVIVRPAAVSHHAQRDVAEGMLLRGRVVGIRIDVVVGEWAPLDAGLAGDVIIGHHRHRLCVPFGSQRLMLQVFVRTTQRFLFLADSGGCVRSCGCWCHG